MIEDLIKYNKDADSKQIADTVIYKYLFEKQDTHYCSSFKRIESDISSILTRIPAMFSNYTNHDITHSLRIADYMVSLLPGHIEEYSHTELAIMLISAIFHILRYAFRGFARASIYHCHEVVSGDYSVFARFLTLFAC